MSLEISGVSFGDSFGDDVGDSFGDSFGADLNTALREALSGNGDMGDDVLGALEDMGADPDLLGAVAEEVGRRRARGSRGRGRGRPQGRPAQRPAMVRVQESNRQGAGILGGFGAVGNVNVTAKPQAVGGRILPITSGLIAAGATAVITLNPQDSFRAERIVYAGPAATFSIQAINIKNVPQTISAGDVPADAFTANAVDQRLNFSPCPVGGQIQVQVLNFSAAAAIFRGMFIGSAAIQV